MAVGFGFNLFESLVAIVGGGMIGTVIYLYVWELLTKLYRKYFPKKTQHTKFYKHTRWVVRMIRKYELYGVALLSPWILTLPVGCFIANQIEPNKWRIKLFMFVSLTLWTILFWLGKQLISQSFFNN
jgi:hypothetical protein